MKPFVIDIYRDDGHMIRKNRVESDSLEAALQVMELRTSLSDVNRIVVSRRLGGGGLSKVKVWTRNMSS